MKTLMICKYPPIQGGVSAECYWTAQLLTEMGHQVLVLTNAQEVEAAYRINLDSEDGKLLSGFRKPGMIRVVSTATDKRHVFVPQTNPSVSKLLSLGIGLVETEKPDFIWSHYLEPYGVVAYLLSKLTGVPYVVRHAGSDIGRLMLTPQLKTLHEEVLRGALCVMTRPANHKKFLEMGIPPHRLVRSVSAKMRSDLFFPTPISVHTPMIIGVYGKTGESKGTGALLQAVASLKSEGFPLKVNARWGGRDIAGYLQRIRELSIEDTVDAKGFIPHWRIPDFIRSCDAIFFLENRFSITFHHPSVPLEVISCGRPVITTKEVASKSLYEKLLVDRENAFVIEGEVTGASVAVAVKRVRENLEKRCGTTISRPIASDIPIRIAMHELLETIQARLSGKGM